MTIETQQDDFPPSSDQSLPSGGFSPLKGVRVVELSHMIFGPACGMFLAFLGAEVIKVEPVGGDKTRQLTGMGASFFALFNRGKKSVVLDLHREEGREALDRLLASADILVENFRDGTLAGMGLELSGVRARFPELITVSCKGVSGRTLFRSASVGRNGADDDGTCPHDRSNRNAASCRVVCQ